MQKPFEKALERGGGRQGTCRASGGSAVSPQARGPPQRPWPFPRSWGLCALPWEASGLLRTQMCCDLLREGPPCFQRGVLQKLWGPVASVCHDPRVGPDYPILHPPALVALLSSLLAPTLVSPGHRTLPVPQPGRLLRTSCPRALRAEKGGGGHGAHQEEVGTASCGTYVSGSLGHQSPPQVCPDEAMGSLPHREPPTPGSSSPRCLVRPRLPPLSPGPPPPSPRGPLEGSRSCAVPRRTLFHSLKPGSPPGPVGACVPGLQGGLTCV